MIEKFFDFCYTPIIESGGEYSLKPTGESTNKHLQYDVILLCLAGRYFDFNCHINRTLIINPKPKE
jgi:nucleosome binding factor SPN SPT16 subunit